MRVIIAGGSGMIGRALTSLLLADGDEVIILSRNPHKVDGLVPGSRAVQWDGKTIQDWVAELETADAVVNLTGENLSGAGIFPTRWTKERKQLLVSSRLDAGNLLSNAIGQSSHRPAVFVQQSGVGYYGTQQVKELTEQDASGDDFPAKLLIQWEATSKPLESMGIRRVVTRSAVVLSTGGGALRPMLLQYKLFAGGPLGSGQQVLSWIHIDDEVSAIRFLIKNDQAEGVYNLSSPDPKNIDEFGRTIAKVMKRPHYLHIPSFAMRLAFGEVASMLLEGQRVAPRRLLDAGFQFKYPGLEASLRNLLDK